MTKLTVKKPDPLDEKPPPPPPLRGGPGVALWWKAFPAHRGSLDRWSLLWMREDSRGRSEGEVGRLEHDPRGPVWVAKYHDQMMWVFRSVGRYRTLTAAAEALFEHLLAQDVERVLDRAPEQ